MQNGNKESTQCPKERVKNKKMVLHIKEVMHKLHIPKFIKIQYSPHYTIN